MAGVEGGLSFLPAMTGMSGMSGMVNAIGGGGFSWSDIPNILARYDSNEPTSVLTKTAANFTSANSEYLSNATANIQSSDSAGYFATWFQTSTAADQTLFSSSDNGGTGYLVLTLLADGSIRVEQRTASGMPDMVESSESGFNDGDWHLIVLQSSGTAWSVSIDDVALTLNVIYGTNSGDWFADTASRDNLLIGGFESAPSEFISSWKTNNTSTGSSTSTQVKLPLESGGTYNFYVSWGDGNSNTITTWNQAEVTHTYSSAGTYTIRIVGTCIGFGAFNNSGDRLKLLDVTSWGTVATASGSGYFYGCANFAPTETFAPNTTVTTDFSDFLRDSTSFNQVLGIDTSAGTNFGSFLRGATSFNQVLGIDTSAGTNFSHFMRGMTSFNQVLGIDTSAGTNFGYFLRDSTSFNQVLGIDTAAGTNFSYFLRGATSFNQVLGIDTSAGTNFTSFLYGATSFNQVLGIDTGAATTIAEMLNGATSFDSDLSGLDITSLVPPGANDTLTGSAFSQTNYDLLLVAWEAQVEPANITFSAGSAKYGAGAPATARAALVANGWTITDGGPA